MSLPRIKYDLQCDKLLSVTSTASLNASKVIYDTSSDQGQVSDFQ